MLTKSGDATAEVRGVLRAVGEEESGLHRYFYVTRADQTVVMTVDRTAPLAEELRSGGGWTEPGPGHE